ncbi:MAG: hypothetical protein JWM87_1545 [Candidatus Eremiobacteraeota bacterium]|nr:hypothetical protein [Candidatus Eremiobacteraeota bacterium]
MGEVLEQVTDEVLLDYAERFVGVGDPFAPYWFLWTGPGFPNLPGGSDRAGQDEEAEDWHREEASRLLTVVDRWSANRRPICRFEELHDLATARRYPYRKTIAAIAEACRGGPLVTPGTDFDASDADVFRAELWPITTRGLEELGSPTIFSAFMHSARAYSAYRRIRRLHHIRAAIDQFEPSLVFMFGRSAEALWLEMPEPKADVKWKQRGSVDWAVVANRLYVSSPAPNPFYMAMREREQLIRTVGILFSRLHRPR